MNILFYVLIKIVAVILILTGIVGLFLPIIPGIAFIFLGSALLIDIRVLKKIKQIIQRICCRLKK